MNKHMAEYVLVQGVIPILANIMNNRNSICANMLTHCCVMLYRILFRQIKYEIFFGCLFLFKSFSYIYTLRITHFYYPCTNVRKNDTHNSFSDDFTLLYIIPNVPKTQYHYKKHYYILCFYLMFCHFFFTGVDNHGINILTFIFNYWQCKVH